MLIHMLKQNDAAPAFSLPDQDGKIHALSDYAGKWVLVYFYPKDDTPGCTEEACKFRDSTSQLEERGLTVIGISTDAVVSHRKFADKYELPFTLLADTEKKTVGAYGVWAEKSMYGKKYMGTLRSSFLIRPEGTIAKVYENVKPGTHAEEILHDMNDMIS